jgi:hypothetical protein
MWTFQEAVMVPGREVYFIVHRRLIRLMTLADTCRTQCDRIWRMLGPVFETQCREMGLKDRQIHVARASRLFEEVRTRVCSEQRDRIFAMRWVLEKIFNSVNWVLQLDHNVEIPFPDYNKSLSEIYVEAAAFIVGTLREIKFLTLAAMSPSEMAAIPAKLDLPSWVPDFERLAKVKRILRSGQEFCFHSVRTATMSDDLDDIKMRRAIPVRLIENNRILQLAGVHRTTTVAFVSQEIPHADADAWESDPLLAIEWEIAVARVIRNWFDRIWDTGRQIDRSFMNNLAGMLSIETDMHHPLGNSGRLVIDRLALTTEQEFEAIVRKRGDPENDEIPRYTRVLQNLVTSEKSCLFLTGKEHSEPNMGKVGCGFGDIRDGDLLVAVPGLGQLMRRLRNGFDPFNMKASDYYLDLGRSRLVLRPTGNTGENGERFKLVGKAVSPIACDWVGEPSTVIEIE